MSNKNFDLIHKTCILYSGKTGLPCTALEVKFTVSIVSKAIRTEKVFWITETIKTLLTFTLTSSKIYIKNSKVYLKILCALYCIEIQTYIKVSHRYTCLSMTLVEIFYPKLYRCQCIFSLSLPLSPYIHTERIYM